MGAYLVKVIIFMGVIGFKVSYGSIGALHKDWIQSRGYDQF